MIIFVYSQVQVFVVENQRELVEYFQSVKAQAIPTAA